MNSPQGAPKWDMDFLFTTVLGFLFLMLSFRADLFLEVALVFWGLAFWEQAQGYSINLRYSAERPALILEDFHEKKELPFSEIKSVVQKPCNFLIELRTSDNIYRISRNIEHLILLQQLGLTPSFAVTEHFNLHIRVSRYNIVMILVLIGIQLSVGSILISNPGPVRWLAIGALVPSLIVSFFLLFRHPLLFLLTPNSLEVKRLLGKRTFPIEELTDIRTDQYFFGGGLYYLVRFVFGKTTVILDEFYLATPIYLHRNLIRYFWIDRKVELQKN